MSLEFDDESPVFSAADVENISKELATATEQAGEQPISTDEGRPDLEDLPLPSDDPQDDGGSGEPQNKEGTPEEGQTKEKLAYSELEERWKQRGGALKEERQKRQAAEERATQYQQALATMDAIRNNNNRLNPIPDQRESKYKELPDPNTDARGFLQAIKEREVQREATVAEQTRYYQEQAALDQVHGQFAALANELKTKVPDYEDAVNHLRSERIRDYKMYGLSDEIAEAEWDREASNIIVQLMRAGAVEGGKHPAIAVYEYAQRRGYVPKGAQDRIKGMQTLNKTLSGSTGTSGGAQPQTATIEWVNEAQGNPAEFLKRMRILNKNMGIEE